MNSEEELRHQRDRGQRIRRLMEDPLLSEAIETMRDQYAKEWLASDPTDTEYRERLYLASNLTGDFLQIMQQALSDGVIAADKLSRLRKKSERDTI